MRKKLYRALVLSVCCLLLCTWALAATCSIRVTVKDDRNEAVPDFSVELCRVTAFDGERHSLTEAFSELGISAETLAGEGTAEQAEAIYQYLLARELNGTVLLTDDRGAVDFTALEQGIYLVFERGGQILSFRPYLVCLPTESEGELYYNIASVPKVMDTDSRSIMVMKLWEDEEDAAGRRPDHVQVTLYRDGTAIRTVVLNEACLWQHTFTMLPGDGVYTVEETPVRNYTGSCEEVAEGFVLTNTYDPDDPDDPDDPPFVGPDEIPEPRPPMPPQEPDVPHEPEVPQEPTLPQTGFVMWYVYVLMLVGTALVIWGLAEVCLSKEEE